MKANLTKLNQSIIKCKQCPRLVQFIKKIATEKRKQYLNETYWAKPITGHGDPKAQILFVGLAPAAHGGTRTGRVFTGDASSTFLFQCLYKAKLCNQPTSVARTDGLKLYHSYITTALKWGNIFNKKEIRKISLFFLFLLFYFIKATNVLASCYDDLEVSVKKHEYNKDMIKFTFLNNSNKEIAIDEYGIKTLDDQIIKSIVKNIYDDNQLKGFIYLSVNGYGKLLEYISLSNVNPKIEKKYYYKCRYAGSIENLK